MEKRVFGKTGMEVSVLGFGGAEIGFEGATPASVREILSAALDAGLNVIDTAECYMDSEELIGEAVSSRRQDFYLFTKCGHKWTYTEEAWGAIDIAESLERSLKRLKTDYVDLLQLHSCSKKILQKGECIKALQKAKEEGKVRFIGYSGDGDDALYAIKTGAFDVLQTSCSIADQEVIEKLLPLAGEKGMGVIAKRPIANAAWRYPSRPQNNYIHEYWERLRDLKYDFINGNADAAGETALRFTLSCPNIHTMIVGTNKPTRWLENAKIVAKGNLSQAEFDKIRSRWKEVAGKDWVGQV
ncbi:MAG TPA: aldo/keto reductase [Candidatus Melainabacteria bacterium]|nr:aldo/keto reductase [Candidatus Melainabacteria bacterium]